MGGVVVLQNCFFTVFFFCHYSPHSSKKHNLGKRKPKYNKGGCRRSKKLWNCSMPPAQLAQTKWCCLLLLLVVVEVALLLLLLLLLSLSLLLLFAVRVVEEGQQVDGTTKRVKQGQVGQRCGIDCLDFHWFILLILFVYLFTYLFIYLLTYLFIYLYIYLPIYLFSYLFLFIFIN